MTDANTTAYYRRREEWERGLAAIAVDPAIASIHHELANRYGELIALASRPEPRA